MFKRFIRKKQHIRYMRTSIRQLRYSIVNDCIRSTIESELNPASLQNKALLIRKYQRKLKWITL